MKNLKKTWKLKPSVLKKLKVAGIVIAVFLVVFSYINSEKNSLKKLGYSNQAISSIVQKWQIGAVKEIGENKTVNAAFESKDYVQDNLQVYKKVTYQKQKDLIKNINKLIKKGYKANEISMILAHGNNEDVSAFAKRKKVKYLEQYFSIPYAKLKNYDRYVAYYDKEREDAETTVLHVNMDFDQEEYTNPIKIDTFSEDVLVNKHRMLTEKFVPKQLKEVPSEYLKNKNDEIMVHQSVLSAFKRMMQEALKDGKHILINSGYRSYQDQLDTMELYREAYGQNYVDNYVAKAGFSEHQTGMSIDVASQDVSIFVESEEYGWMMDHAYEYGFILRYPKSKEEITGYKCEAWHYRYVGIKAAKYIHDHNITYDEYYMMFLEKNS